MKARNFCTLTDIDVGGQRSDDLAKTEIFSDLAEDLTF